MALGKHSRSASPSDRSTKRAKPSPVRAQRAKLSAVEASREEQEDIDLDDDAFEAKLLDDTRDRAAERRRKRQAAHHQRQGVRFRSVEESYSVAAASEKLLADKFVFVKAVGDKDCGLTSAVSFRILKSDVVEGKPVDQNDLSIVKRAKLMDFEHRPLQKGPAALNHEHNMRRDLRCMAFLKKAQDRVMSGELSREVHWPALQFSTAETLEDNADPFWAMWYAMPIIRGPTLSGVIMKAGNITDEDSSDEGSDEDDLEIPAWLLVLFWQQIIEGVAWLHTPTPDKPYVCAHGDLNDGNVMLDSQTPALEGSLVNGLLGDRFTPRLIFIDFDRFKKINVDPSVISADKSAKDYQRLVKSGQDFWLLEDCRQLRYNLRQLLEASELATEFAGPKKAGQRPLYMHVLDALGDGDVGEALRWSKVWTEAVKTVEVDDEEVEKWWGICEDARMELPSQKEINQTLEKFKTGGKLPKGKRSPKSGAGEGKSTGGTGMLGSMHLGI